jgi:hypothetical protein
VTEDPLDWTVHPFRNRPGMGWGILILILGMSTGAVLYAGSVFWGIFCFAVLFLSLESFYFPTRFVLTPEKLMVSRRFSRSEREWRIFRRCYADPVGLTLSPFTRSNWLESYRSIRLRFGTDNRDRVVAYVRDRLEPSAEWVFDRRWNRGESTA